MVGKVYTKYLKKKLVLVFKGVIAASDEDYFKKKHIYELLRGVKFSCT